MVKDREAIVDIESNPSECEHVTRGKRVKNMIKSLGLTLSFKWLDDGKNIGDAYTNRDIESLVKDKFEGEKRGNSNNNNNNMPVIGKTQSKEKQKGKNSKKACKPPRPRRGPTLSASDMRLVKEISELVMKKRARIERLKKLRSPSASAEVVASSNMSVFAMINTLVFLFVIIFQGIIKHNNDISH